MNRLPLFSALAACGALAASPAVAQEGPEEPSGDFAVNQLIIYGDDDCPVSTGDVITVCARLDEGERYRTPERLRNVSSPDNESWARRAQSLETVGAFGPLSCTPAGAGGELGCTVQFIEAAYAERAGSTDIRMGQLVAEARSERLAEIDDDAALTQARVEELERQEFERRRAAQSRALPDEEEAPPPVLVNPDRIPSEPPAEPQTRGI